ncbi:cuticle protein 10.9-like [Argiope bruennichi]|uniref:Adult-specific rigid cuticular protein 15.7 like protein n=1 Tax=Argiope bruennichi TaxID=94029 RepID=A0A8T0EGR2_ARGBR|nr:cuticle protein 10.9-like [Argiope bruennichi]KAF8771135.1 Adult-specific rigid cuticular protein 15.7 like protein [Argiope bruennichi]
MSLLAIILLLFSIFNAIYSGPAPVVPVAQIPQPYGFGYEFGDGLGMTQHRSETADTAGIVRGRYGFRDPQGLYRNVEYIADSNGYRAVIRSNEPGAASQNTADAVFIVQPPPPAVVAQALRRPVTVVAVKK